MNATRETIEPRDDGRLHAAAGLGSDRRIILFQGGLSPRRGLHHLAAAAAALPEPWSIVMMGWGPFEAEMRKRAEELGAQTKPESRPLAVLPPVPQEELASWTAGATLGIIPYENTGLNHLYCTPNKLWEFPNAGVPILATDLVEMRKMIDEWKIGFLLPREFSAADIVSFVTNVDETALLEARQNCAVYSHRMSWAKFEPVLLGMYSKIAARGSA